MPTVKTKSAARPRKRAAFRMPRLSEDVISFSECRNNLAACLKRVGETHRLIFITQNGRPTSFIGNIEDWDAYVDMMETRGDIETGLRELDEGKGIPHEQVMREMDEMIQGWIREDGARRNSNGRHTPKVFSPTSFSQYA